MSSKPATDHPWARKADGGRIRKIHTIRKAERAAQSEFEHVESNGELLEQEHGEDDNGLEQTSFRRLVEEDAEDHLFEDAYEAATGNKKVREPAPIPRKYSIRKEKTVELPRPLKPPTKSGRAWEPSDEV